MRATSTDSRARSIAPASAGARKSGEANSSALLDLRAPLHHDQGEQPGPSISELDPLVQLDERPGQAPRHPRVQAKPATDEVEPLMKRFPLDDLEFWKFPREPFIAAPKHTRRKTGIGASQATLAGDPPIIGVENRGLMVDGSVKPLAERREPRFYQAQPRPCEGPVKPPQGGPSSRYVARASCGSCCSAWPASVFSCGSGWPSFRPPTSPCTSAPSSAAIIPSPRPAKGDSPTAAMGRLRRPHGLRGQSLGEGRSGRSLSAQENQNLQSDRLLLRRMSASHPRDIRK